MTVDGLGIRCLGPRQRVGTVGGHPLLRFPYHPCDCEDAWRSGQSTARRLLDVMRGHQLITTFAAVIVAVGVAATAVTLLCGDTSPSQRYANPTLDAFPVLLEQPPAGPPSVVTTTVTTTVSTTVTTTAPTTVTTTETTIVTTTETTTVPGKTVTQRQCPDGSIVTGECPAPKVLPPLTPP